MKERRNISNSKRRHVKVDNHKSPVEQYAERAILTPDLPKKKMRDHQDDKSGYEAAVPFEVQYTLHIRRTWLCYSALVERAPRIADSANCKTSCKIDSQWPWRTATMDFIP